MNGGIHNEIKDMVQPIPSVTVGGWLLSKRRKESE